MCKSHNDDGKFGDKQVKAIKSGTTCGLHCLLNLIELSTLFDYGHYKIDLFSDLIRDMDYKKIFVNLNWIVMWIFLIKLTKISVFEKNTQDKDLRGYMH